MLVAQEVASNLPLQRGQLGAWCRFLGVHRCKQVGLFAVDIGGFADRDALVSVPTGATRCLSCWMRVDIARNVASGCRVQASVEQVLCGGLRVSQCLGNCAMGDFPLRHVQSMAQVHVIAQCLLPALVGQCKGVANGRIVQCEG